MSRAVIEQAEGRITGERGCDAETAFREHVARSQPTSTELRDVAQVLVDSARRQS